MWGPSSRGAPPPIRPGLVLLGGLAAAFVGPSQAVGLTTSCHIHPPAELVERGEQPTIIGPFGSSSACESERLARFGDLGRCHCVQGFAPRPRFGVAPVTDGPNVPGSTGDQAPPLP